MTTPDLSVIVTVVEGGETLARCLTALTSQEGAAPPEVIVPFDATVAIGDLPARFPTVRFLELGALIPEEKPPSSFVQHRLFDRRRARGLHAATGRHIAIVEDRGAPRSDWAKAMLEEHAASADAAVGGVVVNVAPGVMERALFICDFNRYAPPVQEGAVEYITDINICYKREALESLKHLWTDRYEEATINWALKEAGRGVRLSSRPVVVHKRSPMPFGQILAERVHWGRVFGIMRARRWSVPVAIGAAGASIAAPAIVLARHTAMNRQKGASLGEILATLPPLLLLLPAWSLGEAYGYIERVFQGTEIQK
ncbi:MAG: hypothetical protein H6923_06165 [Alphaproteobacteria bacterium]|nr:hypothetical protein [Alphaproteobacteria bacterium]